MADTLKMLLHKLSNVHSTHSQGTSLLIASAGQVCRPVPATSQASPWRIFLFLLICYS